MRLNNILKLKNFVISLGSVMLLLFIPPPVNALTFTEYEVVSTSTDNIIGGAVFTWTSFDAVAGIQSLKVDHKIGDDSVTLYYDVVFRTGNYDNLYTTEYQPYFMGDGTAAYEAADAIITEVGTDTAILFIHEDLNDSFVVPWIESTNAVGQLGIGVIGDVAPKLNQDSISHFFLLYNQVTVYAQFSLLTRNDLIERDVIELKTATDPVPEPATMILFATGLASLAASRFKRKKK